MSPHRIGVTAVVLALAAAATATAQPSVWTAARDRDALRSEQLVEEAERRLEAMDQIGSDSELRTSIERDAAIASLQAQGASHVADPRVHLALGRLWMMSNPRNDNIDDYRKAIPELEWVVRHVPDGPMAAQAWRDLSTAYAKLSLREREREAYARVLDLEPAPPYRGMIYYNRGDLELEAGELDAAIADYHRAIPLTFAPFFEPALVYWSLGLALERSGDLPSALDAVAMAQTVYSGTHYLTALDDPNAFFVPAYEKSYLEALGELACARDAPSTELAIRSYENARTYFEDYVLKALRDHHRGLSNAKLELRMIERKLKALEAAPEAPSRTHKSDVAAPIRPGCPRPEIPEPPVGPLQLPITIPPPAPVP